MPLCSSAAQTGIDGTLVDIKVDKSLDWEGTSSTSFSATWELASREDLVGFDDADQTAREVLATFSVGYS